MDCSMVSSTPIGDLSNPAPPPAAKTPTHPVVMAMVLIWISVELIGDGLLALANVLRTVTNERSVTPS